MALFKRNKKEEKKEISEKTLPPSETTAAPAPKTSSAAKPQRRPGGTFQTALRRPRITEKATERGSSGVYVFEVDKGATKKEIARAVQELYKVVPIKVHTTPIPEKSVSLRNRRGRGVKKGGKKTYVYLKRGDAIELI